MSTTKHSSETSFGKKLAHVDKEVRDAAIEKLSRYVAAKPKFTEQDFLKLWKGIYYCFWLSDKPLVQQELATKLAEISLVANRNMGMLYIQTFWQTVAREWIQVDRHRVDKYLMLMRRVFYYTFLTLDKYDYPPKLIKRFHTIMRLFVFHHAKVPASITLHVIDIYYTELNRLIDQKRESTEEGENNTDISKEINIPVHLLIDPIVELSVNTNNNMIFNRIKTEFYDEIMGEDSVFKKDVITCLQNHSDNIPTDPNDLSPDHEFYTINKNKYNLFKQFITIEQNSNSAETVTRNSKTSKTSKTGTDKEGKENKEKTERPKKRKTKLPEIIPQESTLISSSAEPVTGDDENVDPLTGFVIAHKSGTPKKPKLSSPPEPVTPTSSAPVETVNSTSSSKNLKWALDKNTTKTFNKMVPIAPVAPSVNFEATPKRSALRKSLDSQSPSASSSSRSKNSKNSKIAKNAKSPKNNLLLNTLANSYSEAIDDNDILLANIKN